MRFWIKPFQSSAENRPHPLSFTALVSVFFILFTSLLERWIPSFAKTQAFNYLYLSGTPLFLIAISFLYGRYLPANISSIKGYAKAMGLLLLKTVVPFVVFGLIKGIAGISNTPFKDTFINCLLNPEQGALVFYILFVVGVLGLTCCYLANKINSKFVKLRTGLVLTVILLSAYFLRMLTDQYGVPSICRYMPFLIAGFSLSCFDIPSFFKGEKKRFLTLVFALASLVVALAMVIHPMFVSEPDIVLTNISFFIAGLSNFVCWYILAYLLQHIKTLSIFFAFGRASLQFHFISMFAFILPILPTGLTDDVAGYFEFAILLIGISTISILFVTLWRRISYIRAVAIDCFDEEIDVK